jgi:hypothetical protein
VPVQLGGAFRPPEPVAPPSGDERRHQELLAELAAVRDALFALAQQGPPQVTVPPTDLTEILHALDGLGVPGVPPAKPVDPQAIGEAVANAVAARQVVAGADRTDEVLDELKRIGRKFGIALANSAPMVSNDITSNSTRELGRVEVSAAQTLETLLTTLRDEQLRRTDPVKTQQASDFQDGRYRTAGGRRASSGGTAVLQLRNTSTTQPLLVTEFVVGADVSADVQFWKNATLGGTIQTHEVFMPNTSYDGSGLTTIGETRSGAALTGGTQLSPVYRVNANIMVQRDFTYLMMPGGWVDFDRGDGRCALGSGVVRLCDVGRRLI